MQELYFKKAIRLSRDILMLLDSYLTEPVIFSLDLKVYSSCGCSGTT